MLLISILLAVGFLFIIAELFLPGGIVGTIGGVIVLIAIFLIFRRYGPIHGVLAALGSVTVAVLILAAGIRFMGHRLVLMETEQDHTAAETGLSDLVGALGVALSPLRPVGVADIQGRRVDVTADADFIQAGDRVRVVKVEWNRVVVERLDQHSSPS